MKRIEKRYAIEREKYSSKNLYQRSSVPKEKIRDKSLREIREGPNKKKNGVVSNPETSVPPEWG